MLLVPCCYPSPLIHSSQLNMTKFQYPGVNRLAYMLLLVLTISLMSISHAMGDSALEKQKCVEQLTSIAACLQYVGGDAKAPTPGCCSGLI